MIGPVVVDVDAPHLYPNLGHLNTRVSLPISLKINLSGFELFKIFTEIELTTFYYLSIYF